jgi:hypothetical protein
VKRCEGCGAEKDETEFPWRNKAKGLRQNYCRECKRRYGRTWYAKNAEAHKANVARNNQRYMAAAIAIVVAAKSMPCADCGRTFPPIAMDFDHTGDDKILDVSHMRNHNLDKLRAEIAKCEVVCACCHRIRTAARLATRLGRMDEALAS